MKISLFIIGLGLSSLLSCLASYKFYETEVVSISFDKEDQHKDSFCVESAVKLGPRLE